MVKQKEQQDKIIDMFNDIAPTYDITNRVLSLGIDSKWREDACKIAFEESLKNIKNNLFIADIACGTGDMIKEMQKEANRRGVTLDYIVGVDPSFNMLKVASQKLDSNIKLIEATANDIPLESNLLDIVSISYGLRNVIERNGALKEFNRILKPNGLLLILDFMQETNKNFIDKFKQNMMKSYTRFVLPIIGGLISRNFKAYKYLPDSIKNFPSVDNLKEEIKLNKFDCIYSKNYSASVCTLIIAKKLNL